MTISAKKCSNKLKTVNVWQYILVFVRLGWQFLKIWITYKINNEHYGLLDTKNNTLCTENNYNRIFTILHGKKPELLICREENEGIQPRI